MKIQQGQRRAIVIGASSGIGQRLARLLLHDGWFLGVAARREAPLEQLANDFPGQVAWNCIDVTDDHAASRLEQLVEKNRRDGSLSLCLGRRENESQSRA